MRSLVTTLISRPVGLMFRILVVGLFPLIQLSSRQTTQSSGHRPGQLLRYVNLVSYQLLVARELLSWGFVLRVLVTVNHLHVLLYLLNAVAHSV